MFATTGYEPSAEATTSGGQPHPLEGEAPGDGDRVPALDLALDQHHLQDPRRDRRLHAHSHAGGHMEVDLALPGSSEGPGGSVPATPTELDADAVTFGGARLHMEAQGVWDWPSEGGAQIDGTGVPRALEDETATPSSNRAGSTGGTHFAPVEATGDEPSDPQSRQQVTSPRPRTVGHARGVWSSTGGDGMSGM